MEMGGVDLGLILDYEGAPGPGRKRIDAIGQGHGVAGAKCDGGDKAQIDDLGKGRAKKGIRAEPGRVIPDVGIGDLSGKLDRYYARRRIDRVYKRRWPEHAHACLIGTGDEKL